LDDDSGLSCCNRKEAINSHLTKPMVNFIYVFGVQFWNKILALKFQTQNTAFVRNFGIKNSLLYKKRACRMLMKLIPIGWLLYAMGQPCMKGKRDGWLLYARWQPCTGIASDYINCLIKSWAEHQTQHQLQITLMYKTCPSKQYFFL